MISHRQLTPKMFLNSWTSDFSPEHSAASEESFNVERIEEPVTVGQPSAADMVVDKIMYILPIESSAPKRSLPFLIGCEAGILGNA
jgi:hypothetical protein